MNRMRIDLKEAVRIAYISAMSLGMIGALDLGIVHEVFLSSTTDCRVLSAYVEGCLPAWEHES